MLLYLVQFPFLSSSPSICNSSNQNCRQIKSTMTIQSDRKAISCFAILIFLVVLLPTAVHSTTLFTVPADALIVCSDSIENVCTAPTSCNANGRAFFDPGENFEVGSTEQRDGMWTITGGYTIDFPSECEVTCKGDCSCDGCKSVQVQDDSGNLTSNTRRSVVPFLLVAAFWILI